MQRVIGKNCIEMRPCSYVPTQYIEAGSKILVRKNINASNEAFVFNEKGEFLCLAYDRNANPLTQEQLKTISKEYKSAIKRIRDLQKDDRHSEFIRRNARLEAERLKRKRDSALIKGLGENSKSFHCASFCNKSQSSIVSALLFVSIGSSQLSSLFCSTCALWIASLTFVLSDFCTSLSVLPPKKLFQRLLKP